jgi:hypothetical protein
MRKINSTFKHQKEDSAFTCWKHTCFMIVMDFQNLNFWEMQFWDLKKMSFECNAMVRYKVYYKENDTSCRNWVMWWIQMNPWGVHDELMPLIFVCAIEMIDK